MKFRVTARDNRAGGGGVGSDTTIGERRRADAGPFAVTAAQHGGELGGRLDRRPSPGTWPTRPRRR